MPAGSGAQFRLQPFQIGDEGGPFGRARRQQLEGRDPDLDVVPCLGKLGELQERLGAAFRQDRFAEQGGDPVRSSTMPGASERGRTAPR